MYSILAYLFDNARLLRCLQMLLLYDVLGQCQFVQTLENILVNKKRRVNFYAELKENNLKQSKIIWYGVKAIYLSNKVPKFH